MARRKPPVAQTLLPVERPMPPRVLEPLPDWFDPPEAEIARARPVVRVTSDLLENIVPRLRGGDFVLPPFQRGRVWSRAQKVSLLDSIMRGLPIGVIVCCSPQVGETYRPLGDAPASTSLYANVVLDGQQRLTTLLEAASGLIPVRWSEQHGWGERGYVDMVTALCGPSENVGMYAAIREAHGQEAAQYFARACDQIQRYTVTVCQLATSDIAEAWRIYRRMAVGGTVHTEGDVLGDDERRLADLVADILGSRDEARRYVVMVTTSGRMKDAMRLIQHRQLLPGYGP